MHALSGLLHHLGRHVAAEVDLNEDIIGIEVVVAFDHRLAPLCRATLAGGKLEASCSGFGPRGARAVGHGRSPSSAFVPAMGI
jgi:hypothetical protein